MHLPPEEREVATWAGELRRASTGSAARAVGGCVDSAELKTLTKRPDGQ